MRKFIILFALAFFASSARAQVPVAPLQLVRQQFLSSTGVPLAAGCVNFFATGTSTPQAIYADSTGTFQLPNPLTLDAAGEASVWMSNVGYDIVANTGTSGQLCSVSLGTQLWRENNKNPFSIINGSSNYIVACAASDPSGTNGELACRSDLGKLRFFFSTWDSIVEETVAAALTNKTVNIAANTINNTVNTAGHYPRNNGTQYVDSVIQASDAQGTGLSLTTEGAIGATANFLTKLTAATPSTFINTTVADTGGVVGICVVNCGVGTVATIVQSGLVSCTFDAGGIAAGNYVQISAVTAGNCHDAGAAYPTSGQVIGRGIITGGAGPRQIDLFGPEIKPTIPVVTIKKGTGAGNYTSASTTLTAVDGANLTLTTTIPVGSKLIVQASGAVSSLVATVVVNVQLWDGVCNVGTQLQAMSSFPAAVSNMEGFSLSEVLTGDGASHTINLCYATTNAADSVIMQNLSVPFSPRMVFTLIPSN